MHALRRSVNNSEVRYEIRDRLIQNYIGCMNMNSRRSTERMTICHLLGPANLLFPESSALAEPPTCARLCRPRKFEMSFAINCHDCLAMSGQASVAEITLAKTKSVAHVGGEVGSLRLAYLRSQGTTRVGRIRALAIVPSSRYA